MCSCVHLRGSSEHGDVAQMVERSHSMREALGSMPSFSTLVRGLKPAFMSRGRRLTVLRVLAPPCHRARPADPAHRILYIFSPDFAIPCLGVQTQLPGHTSLWHRHVRYNSNTQRAVPLPCALVLACAKTMSPQKESRAEQKGCSRK